jgi:hypothetical protein
LRHISAATSFRRSTAADFDACPRTRIGTRVEESAQQFAEIEKVVRQIIPPDELATLVDNIGFPVSGINMTYNNTGTIGRRTAKSRSS